MQAGASAPSTTFAYQLWADTTTGLLKRRNAKLKTHYAAEAKERMRLSDGRGKKGVEHVPHLKARDAAGKATGVSGRKVDEAEATVGGDDGAINRGDWWKFHVLEPTDHCVGRSSVHLDAFGSHRAYPNNALGAERRHAGERHAAVGAEHL
jgi:hypothetical protein